MKIDTVYCDHIDIGRTTKLETSTVPELQIEQLVLRVRVYCKDCCSPIPKTIAFGFSTAEARVVSDDEQSQDDGGEDTHRPRPPDELVDALQDPIHPTSGRLLAAKEIVVSRRK